MMSKKALLLLTIWTFQELGHNQDAKKEILQFNSQDVFDTPKPEKLIQRILILATNENDLVLDSFLGSGTTAAVAHKMNRGYIGIERGEHAHPHCQPRLKKVIFDESTLLKPARLAAEQITFQQIPYDVGVF